MRGRGSHKGGGGGGRALHVQQPPRLCTRADVATVTMLPHQLLIPPPAVPRASAPDLANRRAQERVLRAVHQDSLHQDRTSSVKSHTIRHNLVIAALVTATHACPHRPHLCEPRCGGRERRQPDAADSAAALQPQRLQAAEATQAEHKGVVHTRHTCGDACVCANRPVERG
eukprot:40186-Chlamydomonas_euryale.AAC.3